MPAHFCIISQPRRQKLKLSAYDLSLFFLRNTLRIPPTSPKFIIDLLLPSASPFFNLLGVVLPAEDEPFELLDFCVISEPAGLGWSDGRAVGSGLSIVVLAGDCMDTGAGVVGEADGLISMTFLDVLPALGPRIRDDVIVVVMVVVGLTTVVL